MLTPPPREASRREMMDQPDASPAELVQSLADITRLNLIGATRTIVRHVAPFFGHLRPGETLRILDVGTGAADIPLALARWARRRGHRVRIVALEVHPTILRYAARAVDGTPGVHVVAGDALEAPIRPGSVDVALCSLVLHHLPEEAVVALLRRLADLVRLGFVVSDFRRGRLAWAAVWLATRALARSPMARHDGPLSVRRSYTPQELTRLAQRAGLSDIRWYRAPAFRQLGVFTHPAPGIARAR
ncbi:MAG TPA: methyltransferase domain-containing protein [Methylomirabilota bacterium]|nr:methyltransferase domain-containing protein [Methylomirabilota bacterium]